VESQERTALYRLYSPFTGRMQAAIWLWRPPI